MERKKGKAEKNDRSDEKSELKAKRDKESDKAKQIFASDNK